MVCFLCFLISDCRFAWFLHVAVTVACPAEPTRSFHTAEQDKPSEMPFCPETCIPPWGRLRPRGRLLSRQLRAGMGQGGFFFSLSLENRFSFRSPLWRPCCSCRRSYTELYLKSWDNFGFSSYLHQTLLWAMCQPWPSRGGVPSPLWFYVPPSPAPPVRGHSTQGVQLFRFQVRAR